MPLFPELEKILMDEAIPIREKDNQSTNFPQIKLGTPQLCLIDLTKPMQETRLHIAGYNVLSTNYFVLIENPENNKWIVISTQKPHYARGDSYCGTEAVMYSGKGLKVAGKLPNSEWLRCDKGEDVCKPAVPSPDTIAKFFYKNGRYFMMKGYKATYTSLETARAGKRVIVPEALFAKVKPKKLSDDPTYHQAVDELKRYIISIKQQFEERGITLSQLSIEYTLYNWRDGGQNPFKTVVRDAITNLPFKAKYNLIDPYGSSDGGTYFIEVEPAKGRATKEVYSVGYDAKPTNELDEREFKSDICKISLDAIIHIV